MASGELGWTGKKPDPKQPEQQCKHTGRGMQKGTEIGSLTTQEGWGPAWGAFKGEEQEMEEGRNKTSCT